GRGVFLWPLLDSFQGLPVTAIDLRQDRAEQLACARLGGMEQLVAHRMDVTELNFDDSSFDVTTALEVVEHIPDAQEAINEITRVSRQAVIVSVPSKEDDNPDHIHLFTQDTMREMFHQAGVTKIKFDYVLNHMIAVANVQQT
ncbi:MAG: methyltransferase domain-containing protein, partial [Planctomycetota bacterium]|nr:methyltransferase domain-containing protein [Planctomycetota bacterium]